MKLINGKLFFLFFFFESVAEGNNGLRKLQEGVDVSENAVIVNTVGIGAGNCKTIQMTQQLDFLFVNGVDNTPGMLSKGYPGIDHASIATGSEMSQRSWLCAGDLCDCTGDCIDSEGEGLPSNQIGIVAATTKFVGSGTDANSVRLSQGAYSLDDSTSIGFGQGTIHFSGAIQNEDTSDSSQSQLAVVGGTGDFVCAEGYVAIGAAEEDVAWGGRPKQTVTIHLCDTLCSKKQP